MTRIFILAAMSAATFVTTPAFAEEHVWQTGADFTVRTTGLDLNRVADRARLLQRVEYASARLCSHLISRRQRDDCTAETLQQALARAPGTLRPVLARAMGERDRMNGAGRHGTVAVRGPRPAPLPSRLSAELMAAHRAFVETLGPQSIWKRYLVTDDAA